MIPFAAELTDGRAEPHYSVHQGPTQPRSSCSKWGDATTEQFVTHAYATDDFESDRAWSHRTPNETRRTPKVNDAE